MTHVGVAPPLIKAMGYKHREDAVCGAGEAGNGKYTHTQSVPRDTQDGWSLGEGLDAILTHVSVARPLTKLMGYVHQEYAV